MFKEKFVIVREMIKFFSSYEFGTHKNHGRFEINSLVFNSQVENLYLFLYSWWYVLNLTFLYIIKKLKTIYENNCLYKAGTRYRG